MELSGKSDKLKIHTGVTIIITRWNCGSNIINCIKAIKKNTVYPYKLIVIDDCSDDDDIGWIWLKENEGKEIDILLRNEKNLGVVTSLNKGVKLAGRDDCIKVDSDSKKFFTQGWIKNFRTLIEKYPKALPSAVISNSGGINVYHSAYNLYRNVDGLIKQKGIYKKGTSIESMPEIALVSRIPTAVCYLTRELIDKVFPLDEHYRWGFSATQLSLKTMEAGYQPVYYKGVIVFHESGGVVYKDNKMQKVKEETLKKQKKYLQEKWNSKFDKIIAGFPYGNFQEKQ